MRTGRRDSAVFDPANGGARRIVAVIGAAATLLVSMAAWLPHPSHVPGPPIPPAVRLHAVNAQETMARAERLLGEAKRAAGIASEPGLGNDASGLIGGEATELTTTLGSLEAKRLAARPEWAAALAARLWLSGIRPGDTVAAGFSGSFPGLNLALVAACKSLDGRLVAISSVTASSYGANQPGFTWPEIEDRLADARVIDWVTAAVSVGGAGDSGEDLEPEGRSTGLAIAQRVARKRAVLLLEPRGFATAVARRLEVYAAGAKPSGRVALYANVGGNEISLGRSARVLSLGNGFRAGVPFDFSPSRGVLARFAERGVPVLNLLDVRGLALRWGLL